MQMKKLFTASATAVGGRAGHVQSSDHVLDLQLTVPSSLHGSGGQGTNPEQLFAAGYSACFGSALQLVAEKRNIAIPNAEVTAEVSLLSDANGFGLEVDLTVHIPDVHPAVAMELAQAAHEVCPYSKATRGNIQVHLHVNES